MFYLMMHSTHFIYGYMANECLTTPQHKNKSAIGCQTNGIYIKMSSRNEMTLPSVPVDRSKYKHLTSPFHQLKKKR